MESAPAGRRGPSRAVRPPDRPWPPGWVWPSLPGGAGPPERRGVHGPLQRSLPGGAGPPPGRSGVRIAHGRAAAPRADSGFSAGFRGSRESLTSRRRSPMCRGGLSAHGKISTTLNAEAFPHDSADPLAVGPGRMCSIAPTGPAPRTRSRRHPPRHRGRAHATARTTPWRWLRMGKSNWSEPKSQCTYRCVVLPDLMASLLTLWMFLSQCTYRCVVLPDSGTSIWRRPTTWCLNAPTGAWCSLTPALGSGGMTPLRGPGAPPAPGAPLRTGQHRTQSST